MITIVKEFQAKDVMTEAVLTVGTDWPLDHVAEYLVEHSISGAPVVSEEGWLIGVISMTDLVRHNTLPEREPQTHTWYTASNIELESKFAEEELSMFRMGSSSSTCVGDIMTPVVFRVHESASLPYVADMMIRGNIHRLFVTRDGKVVGVITAFDLLQVIRDLPS